MKCPNCKNMMTIMDFSDSVYFICQNSDCADEVFKKYKKPFVFICYDCRHEQHPSKPKIIPNSWCDGANYNIDDEDMPIEK